ncbi:MAG: NADH-quinone oxidoreductase subunit L [Planctomycetota bacterium]|nr:NADH-quinone oxidoreductase subunit L [Planctomycetota bacterium]
MDVENLLFLIPLLPFLGFLVNGLGGRHLPRAAVSWIACLGPGIAFGITAWGFAAILGGRESLYQPLGPWISSFGLEAGFDFRLDALSAVMALVVTGVGSLIHVYSTGYMKDDPGYARYFAYLNLFMAAMLVLVLAGNIVLLFLGWEGVGLSSYLLIGFWYKDLLNCSAGIKAFVVNRIGDLAFLLGIFLIVKTFGSVDLLEIGKNAADAGAAGTHGTELFWIALLLFIGATGKSAQIPLFTWLPDAMAGPTPVSALIHAATMVTSGVYLLARLEGLYSAAPYVPVIVATVGAATALMGALIAFSQTDIKKVLAYSTVSQLGYMFLAAGAGAYALAIFHVVTHAFFKALLFLGAGAVIRSLHHEQDIRRMGGLRERIPQTFWLFLIGALSLAGFPFLAGFVSKDEILHAVHEGDSTWMAVLWIVGLATAAFTACYSTRLVILVFLGKYRGGNAPEEEGTPTAHHAVPLEEIRESPLSMRIPLYVLAALSVVGGYLGVVHFLGENLAHDVGGMILGGVLALAGIGAAIGLYLKAPALLEKLTGEISLGRSLWKLSYRKFYVDELYDRAVVRPLYALAEILYYIVDRILIDFVLVGGAGALVRVVGGLFRRAQTGRLPTYAMWFLCGVIALLLLTVLELAG